MTKEKDTIRLQELAHKWLTGTLDEEEQLEFERWFSQSRDTPIEVPYIHAKSDEAHKQQLYDRILAQINAEGTKPKTVKWLSYAAAAILLVVGVTWTLLDQNSVGEKETVQIQNIAPGGNRATLILGDGPRIELSEEKSGIVVGDSGITYQGQSEEIVDLEAHTTKQLTLSTPRGGTYQLTLPDGTSVWLNASSSLNYPSRFIGDARVVELEGEGYFEVTKSTRPFKVKSAGQEVEVLGTTFNISAYSNQPETKTTLVEGQVKVSLIDSNGYKDASASQILVPGQQAIKSASALILRTVNPDGYVAWKNGYFDFDGMQPAVAFAQLERWYDIDVVYQGEIPTTRFFGVFKRDKKLSSVLAMLRESGLDFKITQQNGKKQLIVIND